jgi:hypothetical protein
MDSSRSASSARQSGQPRVADVTYPQGVMVDRAVGDPQPVSGTDLGNGQVAMNIVLYALDGTDNPVALHTADFAAVGGGTITVVQLPSFATREKFRSE